MTPISRIAPMTYSARSLPESPRTWSTKSKPCGSHCPLGESRNLSFEEPSPTRDGKGGGLCQRFGQGGGLQFETKSCTESNCWHGCSPNFSKLFTSRKAATFISNWKLLTKDCWVLEVYRVTT